MRAHSLLSAAILPLAVAAAPGNFTTEELYDLTTKFFDAFMYPNNTAEAQSINSTFFSEDVIGRVDVTRNFVGRELNTEYIFGLFSQTAANPDSFNLIGYPQTYEVTHWIGSDNIVSVAAIVQFYIPGVLNTTYPCEIDYWATYNDQGQINQYDVTFRYAQWNFDWLNTIAMPALGITSADEYQATLTNMLAQSVCETAMDACTGANQQYATMDECVTYLTTVVPFGQAYTQGFNTLLCRSVHQPMVPFRPDVHCPHIGKTGGGYCTDDRDYVGVVEEKLFTIQPFIQSEASA